MSSKIFIVLGILLIISAIGNSIKCYLCKEQPGLPEDRQKCTLGAYSDCPNSTYCYAAAYIEADGKFKERRGCDNNPDEKYCGPDGEEGCKRNTEKFNLKSCGGICCKTDKCNNYTPEMNGAKGIWASTFTSFVVLLVAIFLLA